jgi:hypothetical protein
LFLPTPKRCRFEESTSLLIVETDLRFATLVLSLVGIIMNTIHHRILKRLRLSDSLPAVCGPHGAHDLSTHIKRTTTDDGSISDARISLSTHTHKKTTPPMRVQIRMPAPADPHTQIKRKRRRTVQFAMPAPLDPHTHKIKQRTTTDDDRCAHTREFRSPPALAPRKRLGSTSIQKKITSPCEQKVSYGFVRE